MVVESPVQYLHREICPSSYEDQVHSIPIAQLLGLFKTQKAIIISSRCYIPLCYQGPSQTSLDPVEIATSAGQILMLPNRARERRTPVGQTIPHPK